MALSSGDHVWYYDGQGNADAVPGEQTSLDKNIPRLEWFPNANPNDSTDYRNNGVHIFNFVYYSDDEIRRGQPHLRHGNGSFAWLDNNPGNITQPTGSLDLGQLPGKVNWHNFLIFPDHDTGFGAIAGLLKTPFYQQKTILEAFQKWAPASDGNQPDQYAADVASAAGVGTDTLLSDLSDDQLLPMQQKIEQIEGSVAGDILASADLPQPIQDLLNS